jgi:C4-dicarboxylate transporter DctQ subunit
MHREQAPLSEETVMIILRIASSVNRITEWVACILTVVMVIAALVQVFARFVLSMGFGWTEELARYLFIWCVFLGASIGMHHKAHLGIEALVRCFSSRWRKIASLISYILCLVLFAHMIWYGVKILPIIARQTSPGLQISLAWPYTAIVLSGALMTLHTIADMIRLINTKEVAQ